MISELIAPTINFLLLVFILVYFTRKPVRDMIAGRSMAIRKMVDEAEAQKTEAKRKYSEFDQKLQAFEAEATQIVERAKTDGEDLKNRIIKEAYASAERIVREAESTVQANIQEYKDQIRRETILRAVEIAERMIRDRLSTDDQHRIVTEYVRKVQ